MELWASVSAIFTSFALGLVFSISSLIASVEAQVTPLIERYLPQQTIEAILPTPSATTTLVGTPVATSTASTEAVVKKVATSTKSATKVIESTTPTLPTAAPKPLISSEEVNTLARASVVNIQCIANLGGGAQIISGSGIIIDSRGIILTNAHIAQYFLLRDYQRKDAVSCVVRAGSPATPLYYATLLYLPPAWIDTNAPKITVAHPFGTGEHDYAFLLITGRTDSSASLPSTFPNLKMTGAEPAIKDQMLIAAYPAGFLDGILIEKGLYISSAFTNVGAIYSFDDLSHVDLFSLGGTVVSQGGSSGGAVVRTHDGTLIGMVATATMGSTTADRDLRAITLSHINRSLKAQGKGGITELLLKDPQTEAANFASGEAISERNKLFEALTNR